VIISADFGCYCTFSFIVYIAVSVSLMTTIVEHAVFSHAGIVQQTVKFSYNTGTIPDANTASLAFVLRRL